MLRIIGGMYKKKKLFTVQGLGTRPTADRLRETLFNILGMEVRNAVVLDLFSGTGALGLEALSRGAESCVFVDNSREALSVIRKNCEACTALTVRTTVISRDASRDLSCLRTTAPLFNLVFADPPYGKGLVPLALAALVKAGCLADEALIVAEHDPADSMTPPTPGFTQTDQRFYGRSALTFFRFRLPGSEENPATLP